MALTDYTGDPAATSVTAILVYLCNAINKREAAVNATLTTWLCGDRTTEVSEPDAADFTNGDPSTDSRDNSFQYVTRPNVDRILSWFTFGPRSGTFTYTSGRSMSASVVQSSSASFTYTNFTRHTNMEMWQAIDDYIQSFDTIRYRAYSAGTTTASGGDRTGSWHPSDEHAYLAASPYSDTDIIEILWDNGSRPSSVPSGEWSNPTGASVAASGIRLSAQRIVYSTDGFGHAADSDHILVRCPSISRDDIVTTDKIGTIQSGTIKVNLSITSSVTPGTGDWDTGVNSTAEVNDGSGVTFDMLDLLAVLDNASGADGGTHNIPISGTTIPATWSLEFDSGIDLSDFPWSYPGIIQNGTNSYNVSLVVQRNYVRWDALVDFDAI